MWRVPLQGHTLKVTLAVHTHLFGKVVIQLGSSSFRSFLYELNVQSVPPASSELLFQALLLFLSFTETFKTSETTVISSRNF